MANVSIVFPKSGKPMVLGDQKGVLSGDPITWQIFTKNRGVKSVKIEFETGEFFEGANDGPKACVKNFDFNDESGYAVMVGRAPKSKKRRIDKYNIYGYSRQNGSGVEKAKLDPKIITDPPAPPVGNG